MIWNGGSNNHHEFNHQRDWWNLYGHLVSKRTFILMMTEIFIWAPKIGRKILQHESCTSRHHDFGMASFKPPLEESQALVICDVVGSNVVLVNTWNSKRIFTHNYTHIQYKYEHQAWRMLWVVSSYKCFFTPSLRSKVSNHLGMHHTLYQVIHI